MRQGNPIGDVSARKAIRETCLDGGPSHSFKWLLDNVYPELFVPLPQYLHFHSALQRRGSWCGVQLMSQASLLLRGFFTLVLPAYASSAVAMCVDGVSAKCVDSGVHDRTGQAIGLYRSY